MRKSEYERIKNLFKDKDMPQPIKAHDVILGEHEVQCSAPRTFSPLKVQCFINSLQKPKQPAPKTCDVKEQSHFQDLIKAIPRIHKQHFLNYASLLSHHKKVSTICARELRRGLSKTSKTNPNLKNKRINKELQRLINKLNREEKDKMKKEDAEKEIKKKNEDARKEELRQKRKFNYLMSQTEAFASFFLNRQNKEKDGEEGLKAARDHLAYVREFDKSPKKHKTAKTENVEKTKGPGGHAQDEVERKDAGENKYVYKEVKQPRILRTTLKEYQLKGLNWLVNLYNQGINGILADDMGLGKTVQAISLLGYLAESEDVWGPFLIVTPASTLHNWGNEFEKFIPNFKIIVYYGSIQERSDLRKRFKKANVIVTSYQVAVSDENILKKIKWQYMILDEAQAIKSINSQRWKILLGFKARNRCLLTGTPIQNNMQELWSLLHFIMPTLFDSLTEFSEWFLTDSGLDETQVDKLHTILKPFMLRRHKDDIKDEIGTKEIFNVYCSLSSRQRILYDEIINPQYKHDRLFGGDQGKLSSKNEHENTIMHLKKVCNHPDLFEKLEPRSALSLTINGDSSLVEYRSCSRPYISSQLKFDSIYTSGLYKTKKTGGESYVFYVKRSTDVNLNRDKILECGPKERLLACLVGKRNAIENHMKRFIFVNEKVHSNTISTNLKLERNNTELRTVKEKPIPSLRYYNRMTFVPPINTFISDSGKLIELDKLLKRLKAEGHRPLIYFQMTKMMDLFEEYLVKMEYSYLRLDGSSKVSARKELVEEWQNKDIFVFILSTRAGGVGINLTAADTVIFYDSDWNPTVDQQAMDRVHRLGQTKKVSVYRLITRDSIEERVMERANKKDEMQKIVIKGNVFEGNYN